MGNWVEVSAHWSQIRPVQGECFYLGHNVRSRDKQSNFVKNEDQWEGSCVCMGVCISLSLPLDNVIFQSYVDRYWLFNMNASKALIKFRVEKNIWLTRLLIFFLTTVFYWSIVDLQYYISFRCTT